MISTDKGDTQGRALALAIYGATSAESQWIIDGINTTNTFAQTIAIDPSNPAVLYAGLVAEDAGTGVGVEKSTDGGASWTPMVNGLTELVGGYPVPTPAFLVAVSPSNPNIVFASDESKLFRSADGASSWAVVFDNGASNPVLALAFDPVTPSTMLLSSGGTWRSTDSGQTWTQTSNQGAVTLAYDPNNTSIVYAANGGDVFKSTDSGLTWATLPGSPPVTVLVVTRGSSTIYGGGGGNLLKRRTAEPRGPKSSTV